ncbi:MAG: Nif3-like dinuclear metal center hexameric protein [bacterium]|nr:Nif3-like dinuclear metal center hexameric protein [bacterium]
MKTEKLLDILELIAPRVLAESWDNVGLLVGSRLGEVSKIVVCLDVEEYIVRAAADDGAEVIVSHHPVIFRPISKISMEEQGGQIIRALLSNNITAVAMHTNLDAARDGVNDVLASLFNLKNLDVLKISRNPSATENCGPVGLGRVGDLERPVSIPAFIDSVKTVLGVDKVRVAGPVEGTVYRVAVMGGSGGRTFKLAGSKGFEVLVTGDVGYHDALEASADGVTVIDAGHRETERVVLKPLAERIRKLTRETGEQIQVEIIYPGNQVFAIR